MRENTASNTSIIVAKSQVLIGAIPELAHLVDPEADRFNKAALRIAGRHRFLKWTQLTFLRKALQLLERVTIPGLALHQVLRKRMIEMKVRAALESGISEVIQIGAGLDSLCFRLHKQWPDVQFMEFDHPATQATKLKVISHLGSAEENFSMHSVDLDCPNSKTTFCDLEPNVSRLIIAEGLLMYLSPDQIPELFKAWREDFGNAARFVFTFLEGHGFHNQSPLVNAWLKMIREPFRWHDAKDAVESLLKEAGWGRPAFEATWLNDSIDDSIAEGEWLAETASCCTQEGHPLKCSPKEVER